MSRILKVSEHAADLQPLAVPDQTQLFAQMLSSAKVDAATIASLTLETSYFQLGEEICSTSDFPDFYFVTQGRVRLLCHSNNQDREVTVQRLEAGNGFGVDHLLTTAPLPYRAIAVESVQVIHMTAQAFATLLEQFPLLRSFLQAAVLDRERRIFFKTYTALGTNHQLTEFLPLLTEKWIAPGQSLYTETGHLWLRQGTLTPPKAVGMDWDCPTPVDWVAQTDVRVYALPFEQWQRVQGMIPTATSRLSKSPDYLHQKAASTVEAPPPQTPIAFPKPIKRRFANFLQRYPWVEQQSSSDCGAACLAMISRYWGRSMALNELREQANVGRTGASLKSLAKAAETIGFHGRPVRANLLRMAEQRDPWIAHWEGIHYVVVYQIKGDKVTFADPAIGRRTLTREAFQAHWTGYALLLEPTTQLAAETPKSSFGRYFGTLLSYKSLITQIIFFSVLIQMFGLVTPLLTQVILDRVVVEKSLNTLNVFAIGLFLFNVWSIGLSSVRQYLLSFLSNRLDLTLISGFIRHTLTLPLKFFESRRVGDILTRVQENQKIQRFLIQQVVLAWLNFLTGFVYLGLMLYYNWRLTLLVLLLIPPIVLLTLGATPMLRQISREVFKETTDQSSVLVEMITGINTIKSVASEQELRWRWEEHLTRQMNTQFKGQKLGIKLQAMSGLINAIGSTALLWYGATLVIQNQLTIGQFVAFNMMMGYVISPVVALANLWDELQEVLISVERLDDVFEAKPEATPDRTLLSLSTLRGQVRFENVSFRYNEDEERNTLQNISFEAKPGQMVAIVGRSGSGKTTLANLLEGLYLPNHGRVMIDGHDIRHVSQQSLRSQFGVVPQECFLFSGTILENITLYRSEYSLEQVVAVAKLAEAHRFIQTLPLGYNTKVGERGVCLSAGQRQRIAIARALLGNPRILILDEATSALDTEAESRFQQNLTHLNQGTLGESRTTFVIAHRLSTIRNADQILVIDQGILLEQGTHAELIATRGLYYHLAQRQEL
jgi:ATP-binding cassette, subfamily B, bacterial HlyB/CyaB